VLGCTSWQHKDQPLHLLGQPAWFASGDCDNESERTCF